MIENVSTQLTVFHCFAHCLLLGRAFASLYALLFLEKEAEIGGRVIVSGSRDESAITCRLDYISLGVRNETYVSMSTQRNTLVKRMTKIPTSGKWE